LLQENEHLGIFHFHSEYSFDSDTKIATIADKIETLNLKFAVLTDHDEVEGSLRLKAELARRGVDAEVPPACEYRTEIGDLIVVGLETNLKGLTSREIIYQTHLADAIVILPHPYDGHKLNHDIIESIDAIEVFNGRSSQTNNLKSQKLAEKFKKPIIFASDAHLSRHLGHVIIAKPRNMNFEQACLDGKIRAVKKYSLNRSDIFISQLIKARKHRDFRLLIRIFANPVIDHIRVKMPKFFKFLKTLKDKL
jgi:predicted metal-dependent phosphoesterase TrpH